MSNTTLRIGALALTLAALVVAQDKVTVLLSDKDQPATIRVNQVNGSITITVGQPGQVVVEPAAPSGGRARKEPVAAAGMHRIDSDRGGADITEERNVVTVRAGRFGLSGNTILQVPPNASLQLRVTNSSISVTGVAGDIEADTTNGPITLKNVGGTVLAHSVNGSITATLDKITPDKAMSFTTLNGKIDVTLPADTKARLRLKSERGPIYSDFDVKLEADGGKPVVEENRTSDGKHRTRLDRSVYGSINGGGPEYRFETMNGSITIRKK